MKKNVISTLTLAKSLIKDGWCKGVFACDLNGKKIDPFSRGVRGFCPQGAIFSAGEFFKERISVVYKATIFLGEAIGGNVDEFNDHPDTTHAMIIEKFDQAIQLAMNSKAD